MSQSGKHKGKSKQLEFVQVSTVWVCISLKASFTMDISVPDIILQSLKTPQRFFVQRCSLPFPSLPIRNYGPTQRSPPKKYLPPDNGRGWWKEYRGGTSFFLPGTNSLTKPLFSHIIHIDNVKGHVISKFPIGSFILPRSINKCLLTRNPDCRLGRDARLPFCSYNDCICRKEITAKVSYPILHPLPTRKLRTMQPCNK